MELDGRRLGALALGRIERVEHERHGRSERQGREQRAHLVREREEQAADGMQHEQQREDGGEPRRQDQIAGVGEDARDGVRGGAERELLERRHSRAGAADLGEQRGRGEEAGDRAVAEVEHDRLLVAKPGCDQVDEAERGDPQGERGGESERAHGVRPAHSVTQSSVSTSQNARPA